MRGIALSSSSSASTTPLRLAAAAASQPAVPPLPPRALGQASTSSSGLTCSTPLRLRSRRTLATRASAPRPLSSPSPASPPANSSQSVAAAAKATTTTTTTKPAAAATPSSSASSSTPSSPALPRPASVSASLVSGDSTSEVPPAVPLALSSGSGGSYEETALSSSSSSSSASEKERKEQKDEEKESDDDDGAAAAAAAAAARAAAKAAAAAVSPSASSAAASSAASPASPSLYPPAERSQIRESWDSIMRWSRAAWRERRRGKGSALDSTTKVAVFGGGSFGTAMAVALARQKADLDVCMLLRDPALCADINRKHENARYLPGRPLPPNVRATTDAAEAISGAQYCIHAVPVQHSRAFLERPELRAALPPTTPIVSVSKGLEVGTGLMLSELIPDALGRKHQPAAFFSGPSFAAEVVDGRPTGLVVASRDKALQRQLQQLFASPTMRVNTTSDVVGVEVCGALKNVLAIAAGIVEGLGLGNNAKAALVSQGCAEIRWLAEKMGAKPETVSGLSGMGDVMLTCYGELSRNRAVGVRLGRGEALADILGSSSQVAEGVATAGVVVSLARRFRVALPVLTAVAQVLDGALAPAEAVRMIMSLPQIEER